MNNKREEENAAGCLELCESNLKGFSFFAEKKKLVDSTSWYTYDALNLFDSLIRLRYVWRHNRWHKIPVGLANFITFFSFFLKKNEKGGAHPSLHTS